MSEEDFELLKLRNKQNKLLIEIYELSNKEVGILNKIIELAMTDEQYKLLRKKAEEIIEEEEI